MRTRRGSTFYSGGLGTLVDRIRVGDIVSYVLNDSEAYSGIVRDIDKKTNKITVAWAGGIVRQHDPEEVVLNAYLYNTREVMDRWGKTDKSVAATVDTFVEHVEEDPQYVGNPKIHGLEKPVGGGFSIMQNLQKKLRVESEEEADENPKEAKRIAFSRKVKDVIQWLRSNIERLRVDENCIDAIHGLLIEEGLLSDINEDNKIVDGILGEIRREMSWTGDGFKETVRKMKSSDDTEIVRTSARMAKVVDALLERWALPPGAKIIKYDVRHPSSGEEGSLVKLRNRRMIWLSDQGLERDIPTSWEKMYASLDDLRRTDKALARREANDLNASLSSGQWNLFEKIKKSGRLIGFGKFKNEFEADDYYLYDGNIWRVTNRNVVNKGAEGDFDKGQIRRKAKSMMAMYWGGPGRQYRLTKQEQGDDPVICPRCKAEMFLAPFTKQEKIYSCGKCGFMIPTGKVVKERVKVEVEPDGEIEVSVASRLAKEVVGHEADDMMVDVNSSELRRWLGAMQSRIDDYYAKHYENVPSPVLKVNKGRRYFRIAKVESFGSESAFAFIDRTNGDILKAASWRAPAKYARGNLFDSDHGLGQMTEWGPQYFIR